MCLGSKSYGLIIPLKGVRVSALSILMNINMSCQRDFDLPIEAYVPFLNTWYFFPSQILIKVPYLLTD